MGNKGATLKTADADERPKRPRVDRGEEFETTLRQMFVPAVDRWCEEHLPEMPKKDVRGGVVDNLVALHTSAFETLVDSVVNAYLSTATGEEDDVVECPKCGEDVVLPEDDEGDLPEPGDEVECEHCGHKFECPEYDEDEDEDSGEGEPEPDPDGGERAPRRKRA